MNQFRTISHADAQELIATDGAVVLDVRTPGEHDDLGHIPGSWLLPLDLVVSAAAVLPDDGRPVLVYCEHGVRSVAASRLLSQAGVTEVLNLAGGMASWTGAREFGATPMRGPAAWVIEDAELLPRGGKVLDLETDPPPALPGPCDAILVFNYLHRPLMPALRAALAPGGRLFDETFTTQQAERGHPKNPAFLLNEGELAALVSPLTVMRSREGEFDGRFVSSIVAERRD